MQPPFRESLKQPRLLLTTFLHISCWLKVDFLFCCIQGRHTLKDKIAKMLMMQNNLNHAFEYEGLQSGKESGSRNECKENENEEMKINH
ncbi:uncharacterized protein LOC123903260 isoform X3 [Trifolium pratense]|uniref:uncharacterized protein LOC123903260 isoform X3 n=1 Tax=Trifolium pratense TaxID=57577 RepID=UPI001E690DB2|nr:uncharacterized protein LOC123903260 isoform X3 [Trifolium pratense]